LNKQGATWKTSDEYYQFIEPSMQDVSNAAIVAAFDAKVDELAELIRSKSNS
jgi:hypothetical protein